MSYKKDSFMFEKMIKYSWDDINEADVFNKLLIEVGNKNKNIPATTA